MIYRCIRAEEREDGRFHTEFEGPTFVDPPRSTPRLIVLHPVPSSFVVGQLYELAVYPAQVAAVPGADSALSPPEGHALPLVELAITGSVTPPAEG